MDAHLDFRDEVAGLRDGYSSPIRRLRELPWVRTVVQVGLRDVGSAREEEVLAARAAGNVLVRAEEVHARGAALLDELAARFDPAHRVYITVDVDGLDPSCAPGTLWPAPGGLLVLAGRAAGPRGRRAAASWPGWTSASSPRRGTRRVTPRLRRRACS